MLLTEVLYLSVTDYLKFITTIPNVKVDKGLLLSIPVLCTDHVVTIDGRQWVHLHAFVTTALHTLHDTLHAPAALFKKKDVSLSKYQKLC